MDSSVKTNSSNKETDISHVPINYDYCQEPDTEVHIKLIPSAGLDNDSSIIFDPSIDERELSVTPAFPNFPTDEEIMIDSESVSRIQPSNDISTQDINSSSMLAKTSNSSQPKFQFFDELKYLLKPTNSLATPHTAVQASQEADSAIKRRARQFDDKPLNSTEGVLMENLTPDEAESLEAAVRLSAVERIQHSSNLQQFCGRSSPHRMDSTGTACSSPKATSHTNQAEYRNFADHLPGLIWSFIAAYAFSIIIFITKLCEIDLIFAIFLQMSVQILGFGVYAFYKNYHLLGSNGHPLMTILRSLPISIGTIASFLAYYYITLPDLSAIRQTQVVITIILSIFFLRERITIWRIIASILILLAIIILMRPITSGTALVSTFNIAEYKTSWVPYSSSWNYIIGVGLALITAISYSIASILNKFYFHTQPLYNTILCFWSALFGLLISIILLYLTRFVLTDPPSFPYDWRLFVGIALGLASCFVFIANQKAIKRERPSIVTLIYSTDIILALILQNVFSHIKSNLIVISGCVLVLVAILITSIEVLLLKRRENPSSNKRIHVTSTASGNNSS